MKNLQLKSFFLLPVIIGIIFSFMVNGISVLTGGEEITYKFLNFLAKEEQTINTTNRFILLLSALAGVTSSALLLVSMFTKDFIPQRKSNFLKWGLWAGMLSVVIYGLPVRLISNHNFAAMLFFYATLIFLLLWVVESQSSDSCPFFQKVKLLPIYLLLFYTMGQPGFNKIFDSEAVMGGYIKMFSNSILAQMPGGIPPFIYFLGTVELLVPVLLIMSLIKTENLPNKPKTFLKYALFISSSTFIMLSFGLGLLLIYPGATNLIIYAIFTTTMYVYVEKQEKLIS